MLYLFALDLFAEVDSPPTRFDACNLLQFPEVRILTRRGPTANPSDDKE
jgi:hypothetical protein